MYRTNEILPDPASIANQKKITADEVREIATEKLKADKLVFQSKAERILPKLLKKVFAKIDNAARKGEYKIKFYGLWFHYFIGWYDDSKYMLKCELEKNGFICHEGTDYLMIGWEYCD